MEKVGLLGLDANALYGALLTLRDGVDDKKHLEQWATLGGRTFAPEARIRDEGKEGIVLSFPAELSKNLSVKQFVTGAMTGEAVNDATLAFKKALTEAAMDAELTHHLGYGPGADRPDQHTNHRNGATAKAVLTDKGKSRIETPRDRFGSFEPLLVPKRASRFTHFDDKVVALYARGLTVREIQAFRRKPMTPRSAPTSSAR